MAKIIKGKTILCICWWLQNLYTQLKSFFLLPGPHNHPKASRHLRKLHFPVLLPSTFPLKPVSIPVLPVRLNGIFILPVVQARNRVTVPSLYSQIHWVIMFSHFSLKSSGICSPLSPTDLNPCPGPHNVPPKSLQQPPDWSPSLSRNSSTLQPPL